MLNLKYKYVVCLGLFLYTYIYNEFLLPWSSSIPWTVIDPASAIESQTLRLFVFPYSHGLAKSNC